MTARAFGRTGLLFGAVLLSLGLSEGVVRVAGLGNVTLSRTTFFTPDAEAGWVGLAGVDAHYEHPGSFKVRVKHNSRGLRDDEHDFLGRPGVRRIVCVGDSFCWGYGVERDDVLATRLSKLLPNTETINLGANGYSTVQELVRLEVEGLRYSPDWVVLLFCWNEFDSNFSDKEGGRPLAAFDAAGRVHVVNRPVSGSWKSPVGVWVRHHLRLYELVEYALKVTQVRADLRRSAVALAATEPENARPATTADPARGDDLPLGADLNDVDLCGPPTARVDRLWEAAGQLLQQIDELCRGQGARLLVVAVTDPAGASEPWLRRAAQSAGLPPGLLDPDRPQRRLGEVCASLGLPYVDATPAFRAAADPLQCFLPGNRHWNAEGHRLVAEAVAARIAELDPE